MTMDARAILGDGGIVSRAFGRGVRAARGAAPARRHRSQHHGGGRLGPHRGGHGHRQVIRLPRPRDPPHHGARRARRRLHPHDRPPGADREQGPAPPACRDRKRARRDLLRRAREGARELPLDPPSRAGVEKKREALPRSCLAGIAPRDPGLGLRDGGRDARDASPAPAPGRVGPRPVGLGQLHGPALPAVRDVLLPAGAQADGARRSAHHEPRAVLLRPGAARGGVGFLPPYTHVILDEAHAIEDVACEHFGPLPRAGSGEPPAHDALPDAHQEGVPHVRARPGRRGQDRLGRRST